MKRKATTHTLDPEVYHKLCFIVMVKKYFFGDDEWSASRIIDRALAEYFDNHAQEIDKMIDDYHEQGGCGDL